MATTQKIKDFEEVIEKIVFNEGELEELKIAIRNFSKGTIAPKQLKQNLLRCRSRMVKDISNFLTYWLHQAQNKDSAPDDSNLTNLNQPDLVNDQLREEIAKRNGLLEVVAKRINALVLKIKKEQPIRTESLVSEQAIKIEIERVFSVIRVEEWLDMCGYDDYMFFVKLYPKLEELYNERFGKSEKFSNNKKDGKEIMANKMSRLGFPEEVETLAIQYVSIRNIFQHSMKDISPYNLEQAQEAFVNVFAYLIVSNLDYRLVSNDRASFYSYLNDFFSKRLAGNPIFRNKMLERFKTVFNA